MFLNKGLGLRCDFLDAVGYSAYGAAVHVSDHIVRQFSRNPIDFDSRFFLQASPDRTQALGTHKS
jgi:hypothetical protein